MKFSWKIIGIIIGCLAVTSYIIAITVIFSGKSAKEICRGVNIVVTDSASANFVTSYEIRQLLKESGISMKGVIMDRLHLSQINRLLSNNSYINQVECYKTLDNKINIRVSQREPIAEVMGITNYYIDNKLNKLPVLRGKPAFVPIISGAVSDTFLQRDLFPFIQFIHQHTFWNAQIEQIYLPSDSIVQLVPRLGDCIINLGTIDRYEQKMNKLMALYQHALNQVGWNRYSYIDLQYTNRVICTKRNPEQQSK
jgi:cell division protein FtsQ